MKEEEAPNSFKRPAGVWVGPPALNRLTAFARLAPSFLILGAQRSGTTTLYGHLTAHPRIAAALRKEVHYFDFQYGKGRRWYLAHFPPKRTWRRGNASSSREGLALTGEGSPYYLVHPLAPERVHAFNPAMKLIAILRDPVERAWSHYRHEVRRGFETLEFEAALAAEHGRLAGSEEKLRQGPHYYCFAHHHYSYLDRGRYAHYLEAWLDRFPNSQLLVLKSEDLFRNADAVVNRAYEFLGVPPHSVPASSAKPAVSGTPVAQTATAGPALKPALRNQLRARFAADQSRLRSMLDSHA